MKNKSERGAVMLESSYCILLAIFVLMFMLSFGFRLYQETVVSIVANEVAEEIVLNYKLRDVTSKETVTASDLKGVGYFRYMLFGSRFETKNEGKGKTLAGTRLTESNLSKDEGGLKVDIEPVVDDIGRRHYEVTVKQKYSFLLGDLLKVIGLKKTEYISETVYVESVDILHYANTVKTTQYVVNKTTDLLTICSLVNKAIELIESVMG